MTKPQNDQYSMATYRDEDGEGFIALSQEFPGISAFGATRECAIQELESVLEVVLADYAEEGWPLPKPTGAPDPSLPSGQFRTRIPKLLHSELRRRAELEGVSQNQLVAIYIARGLEAAANKAQTERLEQVAS